MANYTYTRLEVLKSLPLWKVIDDISDGYVGIVERNAKTYLPQGAKESADAYALRLTQATFVNPFNDTIEGLTGLIFKEPIQYSDDIPSELEPLIENATMTGEHMNQVIMKLFDKALRKGLHYGLVDMPQGIAENEKEEIEQGIRPYITLIPAENVQSWRTTVIAGQLVLTQVKILEIVEENVDDFATKEIKQYRIYETDGVNTNLRVIRPSEDGKSEEEMLNIMTGLNFIPLVALNLEEEGFFSARPPFYDVARLNIGHYNLFTDARYAAHIASVPFYYSAGVQKEEIKDLIIQPNTWVALGDPDSKITIVDYDGKGVAVSEKLMDKIELSIAQAGLNAVTGSVEKTATESEYENTKSQSKLNTYAVHLTNTVELLLLYAYRMLKKGKDAETAGTITINADILKKPLTPEEVMMYSTMNEKGQMTLQEVYVNLKAGNRLSEDFDIDVEVEKVKEEGLLPSVNDA